VPVRYDLINAQRNISDDVIHNNTLACCDCTSIDDEKEFVRFDAPLKEGAACTNYKNGKSLGNCAEQYRLTPKNTKNHRWYYFPDMKKDEVLLFTQFSSNASKTGRFTFHTAILDPAISTQMPQRESIKIRAMAIFIGDDPNWPVLSSHLLKQDILDNINPGNKEYARVSLQAKLAAAVERNLLRKNEVDSIADNAVLNAHTDEDIMIAIHQEKGVRYDASQWTDQEVKKILKEAREERKKRRSTRKPVAKVNTRPTKPTRRPSRTAPKCNPRSATQAAPTVAPSRPDSSSTKRSKGAAAAEARISKASDGNPAAG